MSSSSPWTRYVFPATIVVPGFIAVVPGVGDDPTVLVHVGDACDGGIGSEIDVRRQSLERFPQEEGDDPIVEPFEFGLEPSLSSRRGSPSGRSAAGLDAQHAQNGLVGDRGGTLAPSPSLNTAK